MIRLAAMPSPIPLSVYTDRAARAVEEGRVPDAEAPALAAAMRDPALVRAVAQEFADEDHAALAEIIGGVLRENGILA